MIAVSVRRALLTAGSRNALTPLLTASTPVIAVQPLAKARSSIQRLAAAVAAGSAGGGSTTASGVRRPATVLTTPMASTASRLTTNR